MRIFSLLLAFSLIQGIQAQTNRYSTLQAHSHNDYAQKLPFYDAYREGFGSIEADIFLSNGNLLVGHTLHDLTPAATLQRLYLEPLAAETDQQRSLQLLIDIKTAARPTLDTLVSVLRHFPTLLSNARLRIVISGNRPAPSAYPDYPSFIWFDGRLGEKYSTRVLDKIALISDDYHHLVPKGPGWPLSREEEELIRRTVQEVHQSGKPIRLWGSPDFPEAWKEWMKLGIDFINTDHIRQLADFFQSVDKSRIQMPYNRFIESAGSVVRFGKASLENHALDLCPLPGSSLAVVEERFGLYVVDTKNNKIIESRRYDQEAAFRDYLSTYSGICTLQYQGQTWILWSAAQGSGKGAALMMAPWKGTLGSWSAIPLETLPPARNALPNGIATEERNGHPYVYVVLNGNNELVKIDWLSRKLVWSVPTGMAPYGVCIAGNRVFVSNWAGPRATDSSRERAGIPWGLAYTDPRTGATAQGSVSVFRADSGSPLASIAVGLHPNAILSSPEGKFVYVANAGSDEVSVIDAHRMQVTETVRVGLPHQIDSLQGSSPNGLALEKNGNRLFAANGMDNAVAVIQLGKLASAHGRGHASLILGFVPTEAYPAGLALHNGQLLVANLEGSGSHVFDSARRGSTIHQEMASLSIIPLPDSHTLVQLTQRAEELSLLQRINQLLPSPRANAIPRPVPERLGEPSVFKHVIYIIKENKTYDQVFGDIPEGKGDSSLCIFGSQVTPNEHAMAAQFGWMDNYHASGKSSAEGHQWTDAGMVSDYVEKSVRAWFRSYPHRQEDALVYNRAGFIWNQALDHGKTVRIYGEACRTEYDRSLHWLDLYRQYQQGDTPHWYNTSTIARIKPYISPDYPDCDNFVFSDQWRADVFIRDWKQYEKKGNLPSLLVLSLPNDHSAGTSPGFPSPNAMVADNDLALGRIVDAISHSRYWDSTVIFITEDDSQSGWDHVSPYRTIGLVISPYSSGRLNSTNYNQVSMLRTMEQILGLPPLNLMDASARLMTDCFDDTLRRTAYTHIPANIPLDQMNKPLSALSGKAKKMARLSQSQAFEELDSGEDELMNRILWFYAKGKEKYPVLPETETEADKR